VLLCHTCHKRAHAHPASARLEGLIVTRAAPNPSGWDFLHYQGIRLRPDCEGGFSTVETEEE
jgi:hypothetical protein